MGYHDDGCTFLRIECQYPQCKCSECHITDMWSDELAEYIDKVYETAHKQGYDEAMELLSGTSIAYSFLNEEKHKAFKHGKKQTIEKGREYAKNFLEEMIVIAEKKRENIAVTNIDDRHYLSLKIMALRDCYSMFCQVWNELESDDE